MARGVNLLEFVSAVAEHTRSEAELPSHGNLLDRPPGMVVRYTALPAPWPSCSVLPGLDEPIHMNAGGPTDRQTRRAAHGSRGE